MTEQELKILCLQMLPNLDEAREAYRWLKEEAMPTRRVDAAGWPDEKEATARMDAFRRGTGIVRAGNV